jgi:hypothetical protein
MTGGRNESCLAHEVECVAAEQRSVVIGAVGKHHIDEPGFQGVRAVASIAKLRTGLRFRQKFAISANRSL